MIIAVLNQKGGVGKTTTTLNLGAALAEAGQSVLLLDLDQQQDLSSFALPSVEIKRSDSTSLRKALKPAKDAAPHAYTLLDCPPALGKEVAAALKVAQLALVPVNTEYSALRGLSRLLDTIAAARKSGNPTLRHKILLTMFDVRAGHCRDIAAEAGQLFERDLLQTHIRRSYAFADAAQARESILTYSPKSSGAIAYRALAQEILAL